MKTDTLNYLVEQAVTNYARAEKAENALVAANTKIVQLERELDVRIERERVEAKRQPEPSHKFAVGDVVKSSGRDRSLFEITALMGPHHAQIRGFSSRLNYGRVETRHLTLVRKKEGSLT